jgi:hypothetical protein
MMEQERAENMTLRDYFAIEAMKVCVNSLTRSDADKANMDFEDFVAAEAYMVADAMMKARAE